jgi:hypothetical protein
MSQSRRYFDESEAHSRIRSGAKRALIDGRSIGKSAIFPIQARCAAPDGLFSVPRRPCIIIPAHARRPHGIKPGDQVLIAAAPDYGLVLVYPLSALDEMISRYHSAQCEAESPR